MSAEDSIPWLTTLNQTGKIDADILEAIRGFYGAVPQGIILGMRATAFHMTQWDPATPFGNEARQDWLKFQRLNAE